MAQEVGARLGPGEVLFRSLPLDRRGNLYVTDAKNNLRQFAADGLFLTPPTYFISPEELLEYQHRIIEAFGPGA